jgi:mono/diheme cytochrome c family protein
MARTWNSTKLLVGALCAALGLGSCFAEPTGSQGAGGRPSGGMMTGSGATGGRPEGGGGNDSGPSCTARPAIEGAECRPVTSGEAMRSRIVDNVPQDTLYTVEELASQFGSVCGSCHGSNGLGGLSVVSTTFATVVDEHVLAAIRSDSPSCERDSSGQKKDPSCYSYMPPAGSPNGKPWSERKDDLNDPVTRLAGLLEVWIKKGRPADAFVIGADEGLAETTPYAIDPDAAETQTNLGTCVPDAGMVATELDRSCELDAMFASLEKNPESPLAHEKLGLPASLDETDMFTLDSGELARHGVVAYVPTYPLWTDGAGKLRYVRVPRGESVKFNKKTRTFTIPKNTRFYKTFLKKILDRDGVERYRKIETRVILSRPGGESLFGTYRWNEGETRADLVTDPLNNGLPFKDQLFPVVTDLLKADDIKARWEAGEVRNYTKELDYEGLQRRYALPGSERCIQCHMGDDGFVLGFSPLQLNSRECDGATLEAKGVCDGGVLEPNIGDQLTQLQRFVDYGLITEYDHDAQQVRLEDPQGSSSAPRNFRSPEELTAQGYLLGNCAHCHNPLGYPSVLNPELKELLDFLPSEVGGIFEFPLERYSPRITRQQGKVKLPYITPSLRDIFVSAPGAADPSTPKFGYSEKRVNVDSALKYIDAPWRSLIYRNVDTPFTYADDQAIYPHMPINSPGFDCRAPRIVGEWMVSVPALRKRPELNEDVGSDGAANAENDPQPYYEVKAGDASYLNGLAQAQKRLSTFRTGLRAAQYCPDTSDIVDLWHVVYGPPPEPPLIPEDGTVKGLPRDGVPDRPHWVIADLTDTPGEWNPRRTDWKKKLIDQDFADEQKYLDENFSDVALLQKQRELDNQKLAVSLLKTVSVSEALQTYLTTKVPFGLWEKHEGCDFSGVKKGKDFSGDGRPQWMASVPADEPVFETLPGAAVYNMICVNCHGIDGDSLGRQATTLQELTGGNARVANFRDGFFGPPGSGGANRKRILGDDVTSRNYLAWMALGGTTKRIPTPILDLVAATPVLGAPRPAPPPVVNANMLETARELCKALVTRMPSRSIELGNMNTENGRRDLFDDSPFLVGNGDAELWEKLCSFDNPSPVHGLIVEQDGNGVFTFRNNGGNLLKPELFPAGAAVGNARGQVEPSLAPGNHFPWCVIKPTDAAALAFVEQQKASDGASPLPLCPDAAAAVENRVAADGPEVARFATRGAINAGFAVFAYLDDFIGQGHGREPRHTECELLGAAKP